MKKLSKEEAARFKETILNMRTAEEVVAFVKETFHIE
jgi:phosphotransferase system enzyme I (PtsI)